MFEVLESGVGHVVLSDGTVIVVRATITNVQEGALKPTGPDFELSFNVNFTVKAPEELKRRVKDRPTPPSDGSHVSRLEIWEIVAIEDKSRAYETCVYQASDGRRYEIRLEVDVAIVARTLEYRDREGNPLYFIRWSPCVKVGLAEG